MDDTTLRDLVDELPAESLDLYVMHYEAGEMGGWEDAGLPLPFRCGSVAPRCPRACLGFQHPDVTPGFPEISHPLMRAHPGHRIEALALNDRLDTAVLYRECLISLVERDAERERLMAERREVAHA